jgi:hypothetical protein
MRLARGSSNTLPAFLQATEVAGSDGLNHYISQGRRFHRTRYYRAGTSICGPLTKQLVLAPTSDDAQDLKLPPGEILKGP